jgi:ATP-binding cassette, subfamily C (CFTR/MRP), member 1
MLGSIVAMNFIMSRQAMWLEAIERRISVTNAMLVAIRGIKMSGLKQVLFDNLQNLRIEELRISKRFRKLLIWNMAFGKCDEIARLRDSDSYDTLAYVTQIFAPIATFAVFSALAQKNGNTTLDTARVFTSLSLFALLAEPLGSLIMALVTFTASVGCFTRIQEFLTKDVRIDSRNTLRELSLDDRSGSSKSQSISEKMGLRPQKTKSLILPFKDASLSLSVRDAITVQDGCFGWDPEKEPLLRSITMSVPKQSFTILVGPVGCGKSTLLKAILGEVPTMGGTVQLSSMRVAYCDQTAWHMNDTIQQSITAFSPFDAKFYTSVIRACALEEDLKQLPRGDQTIIGSKGNALSGGQSQRIVSRTSCG